MSELVERVRSSGTDLRNSRVGEVVVFILQRRLATIAVGLLGFYVVLGVFGPHLAPYDPNQTDLTQRFQPPSVQHPFGTDNLGRDVLSRLVVGTRLSLVQGFGSAALAFVSGTVLGTLAGYYSDTWVDTVIMRAMDVIFTFPVLVLALALLGGFQFERPTVGPVALSNLVLLIIVLTLITIPRIARVSRSTVITEANETYVDSKVLLGESPLRIMFVDIQKNALGPVIVITVIRAGYNILIGAGLSFLGYGIRPPRSDWGLMLAEAEQYVLSGYWWLAVIPGVAILSAVVAINLLGDAYRDYLDPSLRL
jgi:peptide/nickel transport system permease protein